MEEQTFEKWYDEWMEWDRNRAVVKWLEKFTDEKGELIAGAPWTDGSRWAVWFDGGTGAAWHHTERTLQAQEWVCKYGQVNSFVAIKWMFLAIARSEECDDCGEKIENCVCGEIFASGRGY